MKRTIIAIAAVGLVLPGAAYAEESAPKKDEIAVYEPAIASTPFGTPAVTESTLQRVAGREDTNQLSQAELAAGVSNNSVGDNAITGNAQIDGNAFQNMSGLSILNVNTGNNVAINAAMNVNISITPAP